MSKGFLLDKAALGALSGLEEEESEKIVELISHLKINERVINLEAFRKNSVEVLNFFNGNKNSDKLEDFLDMFRQDAEKKKKAVLRKAATEEEKIRKKTEAEAEKMSQQIESLMPEAVAKIRVKIRRFLEGGSL